MKDPFNHQKHLRELEETEEHLRSIGRDTMAHAVSLARRIHIDHQGRVEQARQAAKRLQKLADNAMNIVRDIETYVSKPDGPWIGMPLYPKDQ